MSHRLTFCQPKCCATLVFYVWVAQRRKLRDLWVIHENVPSFGMNDLEDLLGDLLKRSWYFSC